VEYTFHVEVENAVPGLIVVLLERGDPKSASIVYEQIEGNLAVIEEVGKPAALGLS
jgi:hypothetical protein